MFQAEGDVDSGQTRVVIYRRSSLFSQDYVAGFTRLIAVSEQAPCRRYLCSVVHDCKYIARLMRSTVPHRWLQTDSASGIHSMFYV